MILYNISYINKIGLRTMLGPNQGRFFHKTREEAQAKLDAIAGTEGGENMRKLVGICGPQSKGTFRVDPFDCYEHGDAKRIYIEETMKYYMIDEAQIEILHDLAKRFFTENRMDGDEMRVSAQIIESVLNVAKELEVPEGNLTKEELDATYEMVAWTTRAVRGNYLYRPSVTPAVLEKMAKKLGIDERLLRPSDDR